MKRYFVTAIGTDSGKTLASTILVEALQADYYKPIQCGTDSLDSEYVEKFCNNTFCRIYSSQFIFKTPASPHEAAEIENKTVSVKDFVFPENENTLIIEGAGGLLVPLNYQGETIADLIESIDSELILVVNLYLGCINHTLLTVNELKRRNITVKGIIFNGINNTATKKIILQHSGFKELLHIQQEEHINQEIIKKYAIELMGNFYE
ncbi:MAG: dethiobiotin synthase [Cytophagales bacterium]